MRENEMRKSELEAAGIETFWALLESAESCFKNGKCDGSSATDNPSAFNSMVAKGNNWNIVLVKVFSKKVKDTPSFDYNERDCEFFKDKVTDIEILKIYYKRNKKVYSGDQELMELIRLWEKDNREEEAKKAQKEIDDKKKAILKLKELAPNLTLKEISWKPFYSNLINNPHAFARKDNELCIVFPDELYRGLCLCSTGLYEYYMDNKEDKIMEVVVNE